MTYKLPKTDTNNYYFGDWILLLRDSHHPAKPAGELQAQVASGDYFGMLATRLDRICQHLKNDRLSDYLILETMVDELLTMQEAYEIKKRHPRDAAS